MGIFTCEYTLKNGINTLNLMGITAMNNKMKALALILMTTFSGVAVAQNADIAMADVNVPETKKKEIAVKKADKDSDTATAKFKNNASSAVLEKNEVPVLREGTSGAAQKASLGKDVLYIHISGGTGEKYTAAKYAEMIQARFKDPKYAGNYPMNVIAYYEETGEKRGTAVIIYSDFNSYDKNGGLLERGDNVIHPYDVVPKIGDIAKWHADKHGIKPTITIASTGIGMSNE